MFANRFVVDMGLTEYAVVSAIEKLLHQGKVLSYETIADEARCSTKTVGRVCKVLIQRGELTVTGSPRGGYEYTFNRKFSKNSRPG